jgi:hypothetical protein
VFKTAKLKKLASSVWAFPAFLTIGLIILTASSINGSSLGVYDIILQEKDSTVVGTPRTVRSDEWVVNTPFIFSQAANNFPVINHDIGTGQDMSVVIDVPYKEWSALFKPQNLVFFILPLEQAFAFKWWFLSYVLMLSIYFFFIILFRNREPYIAALLAVFFALSPFIQWWYQTITIMPIAYTFLIMTATILLFQASSRKIRLLYSALLAYLITCFALIMYPPFQIPCALVGIFILIGWYLSEHKWSYVFKSKLWIYLSAGLVIGLALVGLFILSHQEAVKAVLDTVYPGLRTVESGGEKIQSLIYWPFSYLLINDATGSLFNTDPSDASRFLMFGVPCLPFLLYTFLIKKKKHAKKDQPPKLIKYLLIAATALFVVLMARSFIPFGDPLFKILGLSSVPHARLLIAFGVLNLIFMALAVYGLGFAKRGIKPTRQWLAYLPVLATAALVVLTVSRSTFNLTSVGNKELVVLAVLILISVGLLLHPWHRLRIASLVVVSLFAAFSSLKVNPLYIGTGSLQNSALAQQVSTLEKQDGDLWIIDNFFPIESLPIANGAESFGSVNTYPQMDVWKKYFPGQKDIYNRYAHINFIVDDSYTQPKLELKQADYFSVKTSSCSQILRDYQVGYIISQVKTDNFSCFSPVEDSDQNDLFQIHKRDR